MRFHRWLGEAMRFRIGVGDENVPLDADDRAAGKFRLRLRRRAAFFERRAVGFDAGLGAAVGPSVTKCRPCSPAQVAADLAR